MSGSAALNSVMGSQRSFDERIAELRQAHDHRGWELRYATATTPQQRSLGAWVNTQFTRRAAGWTRVWPEFPAVAP
jgi:hypothetical protein